MAAKIAMQPPTRHPAAAASASASSFDAPATQLPARVGDIVGQHGTVMCLSRATLVDAADLLIMYDHTAAGVVDEQDNLALAGAVTENDFVQAYAAGVSGKTTVSTWLQSGKARLPAWWMETLTVRPSATLLEAAVRMRAEAASDAAHRHLIVREESGAPLGILSALDLARVLCSMGVEQETLQRVSGTPVEEVMKHKAALPYCSTSATMSQVLDKMISVRQNCVLISDAGSHEVVGIVTPRDALRAFTEHTPLDTTIGHWLRGLQSRWEPRQIRADLRVSDAAAIMATSSIHHLIVVSPDDEDSIIGVLSSSDLAQAIGSAERTVEGCSPCDEAR